ncbi:uncharacterized protein V1518DRAFT_368893 [Limtongia smithiae]|uniref:uncharacterized protein n=1 Tax=Limtongia smithiae TaxID=1125753 RepID=UPI0034CE4B10
MPQSTLSPATVTAWRERLFSLPQDTELIMTPAEYTAYFPFMENVYKIHGRSANSKDAVRTRTMYFQCRIDERMETLEQNTPITDTTEPTTTADIPLTVDPAVIAADAYVAALLVSSTSSPSPIPAATPPRTRKPRQTHACPVKIKIICSLDAAWEPTRYSIIRTSAAAHSHDLELSDKIVKNPRLLELSAATSVSPLFLVRGGTQQPVVPTAIASVSAIAVPRVPARARRKLDVDHVLDLARRRYEELEEHLPSQLLDDRKRVDAAMRKWVAELQHTISGFLTIPIEPQQYFK